MTVNSSNHFPGRLSVAPMMDWTDRHFRFFLRKITRLTQLYTEMITTQAILHGDRSHLLGFHPVEHPLILQLGGDTPRDLGECARIAADFGYDGLNLNVGCPSDRVQAGRFGACLMSDPRLVRDCVEEMAGKSGLPVSVKHRLGIDHHTSYEFLHRFIDTVKESSCREFIVHARIAILKGLSPKENRTVPPINYDFVYQLKKDFPDLHIVLNGEVKDLAAARKHLAAIDGVMIGRAAYENPLLFTEADPFLSGGPDQDPIIRSRRELLASLVEYQKVLDERQLPPKVLGRHLYGLFFGIRGSKIWKQYLNASNRTARNLEDLLIFGVNQLPLEALDAPIGQSLPTAPVGSKQIL